MATSNNEFLEKVGGMFKQVQLDIDDEKQAVIVLAITNTGKKFKGLQAVHGSHWLMVEALKSFFADHPDILMQLVLFDMLKDTDE